MDTVQPVAICRPTLTHSYHDPNKATYGKSMKIKGRLVNGHYEPYAHCLRGLYGAYPSHDRHKDAWLVLGYNPRHRVHLSMYLQIKDLPKGWKTMDREAAQNLCWHYTMGQYADVIVHAVYPPLEGWDE